MVKIIIINGYAGSGKTTIINQILRAAPKKKITIISHKPSNVTKVEKIEDIRKRERQVIKNKDIIHTSSSEELVSSIDKVVLQEETDYIIIEFTGELFAGHIMKQLTGYCEIMDNTLIDAIVTVVDVEHFWSDFTCGNQIIMTDGLYEEEYMTSEIMVEQIEFTNIIVLTNFQNAYEEKCEDVIWFIQKLQPVAKIINSNQLTPEEILDTGLFNLKDTNGSAGWIAERNKKNHVLRLVDKYGIGSFVYERDVPFHPQRFEEWIYQFPQDVLRTKGMIRTATEDCMYEFSQAGPSVSITEMSDSSLTTSIWSEDKKTELVFIGIEIDREQIIQQLDKCLVTSDELSQKNNHNKNNIMI